ncbi:isoaspartyl peptidase/L-asparaginase family protein [Celerinatantimonas diazotrophica]|uniref:Isoaspartyl peptidase n=1 Tax=Celerinatantimonas diazotrophica TaxID=412034 RepID=A0A4R1J7P9_9GAMM|nr:isoaspartyl peptidase/L-asparaginase [Celerinatantimonas diazotrophica]TCK46427.1 beta-aspartyl-peptidase (threonine type) [Celerinatantimonas diazotrophica]CAG9295196.1 Isoaspartyl peptidase [Celerinatantimonas diazotrophica]
MIQPVIVIHGGAGALTRSAMDQELENNYRQSLKAIVKAGQEILAAGGSALDAVSEAVRQLEENPLFNAGYGAVFTHEQTHELDACMMDGATLNSGAVCAVAKIRNPILAARSVMENSEHVLLTGKGAEAFAKAQNLEMVDPDFFSTATRLAQLKRVSQSAQVLLDHDAQALDADQPGDPLDPDKKYGTVGAVAIDVHGHLAAATSTGGMTNKMVGRIGDSPIIGAGCYANDATVAISSTGTGEAFMKMVAAYDVSALMAYTGASLNEAMNTVVMEKLPKIAGSGGMVGVDAKGNIALIFNSEGMYRGFGYVGDEPRVGIYRETEQ